MSIHDPCTFDSISAFPLEWDRVRRLVWCLFPKRQTSLTLFHAIIGEGSLSRVCGMWTNRRLTETFSFFLCLAKLAQALPPYGSRDFIEPWPELGVVVKSGESRGTE